MIFFVVTFLLFYHFLQTSRVSRSWSAVMAWRHLVVCLSVCLLVCLSPKCKKTRFSQKLTVVSLLYGNRKSCDLHQSIGLVRSVSQRGATCLGARFSQKLRVVYWRPIGSRTWAFQRTYYWTPWWFPGAATWWIYCRDSRAMQCGTIMTLISPGYTAPCNVECGEVKASRSQPTDRIIGRGCRWLIRCSNYRLELIFFRASRRSTSPKINAFKQYYVR